MNKNAKFIIYIMIVVSIAAVFWIKYDYDRGEKLLNVNDDTNDFEEFIHNNNIKEVPFSCPAKNETITYLDNEYLITNLGELYEVRYTSPFENGHNCRKIELPFRVEGIYSHGLLYDDRNQFYDMKNEYTIYEGELQKYYLEELNNINSISKKYPYIYFYDTKMKSLTVDDLSSNKILIDNKGNINVYTNYGYPTAFNLLKSEDTEIIFDRLDYMGVILSIYRNSHNDLLDKKRVGYLDLLNEENSEVYGLRVITNKGMYNEKLDISCKNNQCSTKLVMDKEFSKYFSNIIYSNGKYVFIKETPTTIYDIGDYVSAK